MRAGHGATARNVDVARVGHRGRRVGEGTLVERHRLAGVGSRRTERSVDLGQHCLRLVVRDTIDVATVDVGARRGVAAVSGARRDHRVPGRDVANIGDAALGNAEATKNSTVAATAAGLTTLSRLPLKK
jgi:hypothetical protein